MSKNVMLKPVTFEVQKSPMITQASKDLTESLDEEDRQFLDQKRQSLGIVTLRGKDAKDESGTVIAKEGNFSFYHRLIKEIPDVSGKQGLLVTFLLEKHTRTYFRENEVVCHSQDFTTGVGQPGGNCAECPLSKWQQQEGRNVIPCIEVINLLTYDWTLCDVYMSQWKRVSAYRFQDYVEILKLGGKPFYYVKTHVTSKYVPDAAFPYSHANFEFVEELPREERVKIKEIRQEYKERFMATAQSEEAQTNNGNGDSNNNELPADVTPVEKSKDSYELPY